MATRSYIGLQKDDGSIEFIYCHYDGYIEGGVGEKLLHHYKTKEQIQMLLDIGNIRSLHETISTQEEDAYEEISTKLKDEQEYIKLFSEGLIDYCYLFKEGNWFVSETHYIDGDNVPSPFIPLISYIVLGAET